MKKLLSVFVTVCAVLFLASCEGIEIPFPEIGTANPISFELENDDDVMALALITSSSLAPNLTVTQPVLFENASQLLSLPTLLSEGSSEKRKNQKEVTLEDITPYLTIFEKLLSEEPITVVEETSDLEGYAYKSIYSMQGLVGEAIQMVLYYNLTLLNPLETPETMDEDSEYIIEGMMVRDSESYRVVGLKTVEDDESTFVFTVEIDTLTYIRNIFEVENNEKKFKISTFIDGIKVSEESVKIETEANETKLVLRAIDGTSTQSYQFTLENEAGVSILKVRYEVTVDGITESGFARVSVVFDETNNTYQYAIILRGDQEDDDNEVRVNRDQEDNETPIEISQLPQMILDYIQSNFPDISIDKASMDDGRYEIELVNDIELYFDLTGNFIKAKQESKDDDDITLDESAVPSSVYAYILEQYPTLTLKGVYYDDGFLKAKFTSGLKLYFDELGNFISTNLDDFEEHPGRNKGEKISFDRLPQTIQSLITEQFPNERLDDITVKDALYTIEFKSDLVIIVDVNGTILQTISDEEETYDIQQLPEVILEYIQTNYPDAIIDDIDLESYGYEIEFKDERVIIFNYLGEFVSEHLDDDQEDDDQEDEDQDDQEDEDQDDQEDEDQDDEDDEDQDDDNQEDDEINNSVVV